MEVLAATRVGRCPTQSTYTAALLAAAGHELTSPVAARRCPQNHVPAAFALIIRPPALPAAAAGRRTAAAAAS